MAKTKTVCVSANLRGAAADDPLAANAPNPDYLAALAGALDLAGSRTSSTSPAPSPIPSAAISSARCSATSSPPATG